MDWRWHSLIDGDSGCRLKPFCELHGKRNDEEGEGKFLFYSTWSINNLFTNGISIVIIPEGFKTDRSPCEPKGVAVDVLRIPLN